MLEHSYWKEIEGKDMMPQSAIGAHNYDQLGNQRVGETHASRMARVQRQSSYAPALVGEVAQMPNVNGAKPMGNTGIIGDLTSPMAYGLLGGMVGAVMSQLAGRNRLSKKAQRNANALAGISAGAVSAMISSNPIDPTSPAARSGVSPYLATIGGAAGAALLTITLGTMGMYETKKVQSFTKSLMHPGTLLLGIGLPVAGAFMLSKGSLRDNAAGGVVGAMAGAALVALLHKAQGVVLKD